MSQPDVSQIQVKIVLPEPPYLVCVALNNVYRLKICYLLLCVFMLCLALLLNSAVIVIVLTISADKMVYCSVFGQLTPDHAKHVTDLTYQELCKKNCLFIYIFILVFFGL